MGLARSTLGIVTDMAPVLIFVIACLRSLKEDTHISLVQMWMGIKEVPITSSEWSTPVVGVLDKASTLVCIG